MSLNHQIAALEAAAFHAWPAASTTWHRGWRLHLAEGYTKRANSVNAGPCAEPLSASDFARIEHLYLQHRLPVVYRLTTGWMGEGDGLTESVLAPALHAEVDASLSKQGFERVDDSWVMVAELARGGKLPAASAPDTSCIPGPEAPTGSELSPSSALQITDLDTWLHAFEQISGKPISDRAAHRAILQRIGTDTRSTHLPEVADQRSVASPSFALWQPAPHRPPTACGLTVRQGTRLGLFDLATHAQARRLGHAEALCRSLLTRAAADGVTQAYLQVVASNTAAIALYRKLGFRVAYAYWYRVH